MRGHKCAVGSCHGIRHTCMAATALRASASSLFASASSFLHIGVHHTGQTVLQEVAIPNSTPDLFKARRLAPSDQAASSSARFVASSFSRFSAAERAFCSLALAPRVSSANFLGIR
jgi:hypothetical protein